LSAIFGSEYLLDGYFLADVGPCTPQEFLQLSVSELFNNKWDSPYTPTQRRHLTLSVPPLLAHLGSRIQAGTMLGHFFIP